ncbi:MAG: hypothetical protein V4578_18700 [Pseudomonadota bacterium]
MDERLTALETHFNAILPTLATKADLEALRADIHKWMVATVMGLFIGFAGLFIAMGNILKPTVQAPVAAPAVAPQATPQSVPPVIIYNIPSDSRQPAK